MAEISHPINTKTGMTRVYRGLQCGNRRLYGSQLGKGITLGGVYEMENEEASVPDSVVTQGHVPAPPPLLVKLEMRPNLG